MRKGSNNNNNRGHAQGKGGGGRRGGTDGFQSQSQSQPQLQSMSVPDAAWVSSRLSSMFRDLEGAGADGGLVEGVAEMMVGEVREGVGCRSGQHVWVKSAEPERERWVRGMRDACVYVFEYG